MLEVKCLLCERTVIIKKRNYEEAGSLDIKYCPWCLSFRIVILTKIKKS